MMNNNSTPIKSFMLEHYKHFNSATLIDAAKGYEKQLDDGNKMMITLAGAMSTAELGKIIGRNDPTG
jgi:deoxyhypusine synthase